METLLSMREAARLLNKHYDTLRKMVRDNRITHVRDGGRIKFLSQDLAAYIEACRFENR